jgi:uncharacterized membrane protein
MCLQKNKEFNANNLHPGVAKNTTIKLLYNSHILWYHAEEIVYLKGFVVFSYWRLVYGKYNLVFNLRIMIDSADCVLPAIIRPLRH